MDRKVLKLQSRQNLDKRRTKERQSTDKKIKTSKSGLAKLDKK